LVTACQAKQDSTHDLKSAEHNLESADHLDILPKNHNKLSLKTSCGLFLASF
jgi:hypothetical protein